MLAFSADGSLITIWARKSDGTRSGDINTLAVPATGGALRTYLPEAEEMAWRLRCRGEKYRAKR